MLSPRKPEPPPVGAASSPFARLRVEPGLYGVTKVEWRGWRNRNWLSWLLAALFLMAGFVFAYFTAPSAVNEPTWYLIARYAATVGWAAFVMFRLILEGTVSRPPPGQPPKWDRQLVDPWWTPIHTATGVVLGLWLVPLLTTVILTVLWEALEICVPGFGDEEINGNRMFDILVAWLGWFLSVLASLLWATQPFPLI